MKMSNVHSSALIYDFLIKEIVQDMVLQQCIIYRM